MTSSNHLDGIEGAGSEGMRHASEAHSSLKDMFEKCWERQAILAFTGATALGVRDSDVELGRYKTSCGCQWKMEVALAGLWKVTDIT